MARWKIVVSGKGIQRGWVQKLVDACKDKFGEKASVSLFDDSPPESRADRFAKAIGDLSDIKAEFESLRDELQEWKDNIPENLQDGDKAQTLEESISELESICDSLDSAEGTDVEFPSMM